MRHMMIDCYGACSGGMDSQSEIYKLLNDFVDLAALVPVSPPTIVPYYYCEDQDDVGISAYIFLKGGHITIHTFPKRECYFLDVLYDGFFSSDIIYSRLMKILPFDESISSFSVCDRRVTSNEFNSVSQMDFGPHLVGRIIPTKKITLDVIYDALEQLVEAIGMSPLIRANVIKDSLSHCSFLQGMIIIAQSHISVYYDIENDVLYFDLFSCAYFDFTDLATRFGDLFGEVDSMQLVRRGDKHKIGRQEDSDTHHRSVCSAWQKYSR